MTKKLSGAQPGNQNASKYDPAMITVTFRLPKLWLDELKEIAEARGVGYTQLIREIIEKGLNNAHSL